LNERLDQLALEMAKIREGQTLYALIGGGPSMSTTLIVVGTTGVILYISGVHSWADIMYVTKKHFNTTVEALKEGVTGLASALARVRHELLEKVGVVEVKVDEARAALEGKIDGVRGQVEGVTNSQTLIEGLIRGIEGKIELTQDQVKQANRGIMILCNVIAESGVTNEELIEFTRNNGIQIEQKAEVKSIQRSSTRPSTSVIAVPQEQSKSEDFSINDILLREGLQHLITMTAPARSVYPQRPVRSISNSSSESLPTAVPLDRDVAAFLAGYTNISSTPSTTPTTKL